MTAEHALVLLLNNVSFPKGIYPRIKGGTLILGYENYSFSLVRNNKCDFLGKDDKVFLRFVDEIVPMIEASYQAG